MKYRFALSIAAIVVFTTGAKTLRLGDLAPLTKGTIVTPQKPDFDISVAQDSTSATFTVKLSTVNVERDNELYPSSFWWFLDDFTPESEGGRAALPQRSLVFQLPGNAENVTLTENYTKWQTITGYTPTPARPPLLMGSGESYTRDNVPPVSYYAASDAPAAEIACITRQRDSKLAYIQLRPFRYSAPGTAVSVCYEFSYTLVFDKSPESNSRRQMGNSQSELQDKTISVTDPWWDLSTLDIQYDSTRILRPILECRNYIRPSNYLIITTPQNYDAIREYARWKKMLGHKCYVANSATWSVEKIKSTISHCYQTDSALHYVLFAGSVIDIPAALHEIRTNADGSTERYDYSDFPYAAFFNIGETIEYERSIYTGRLLVDDPRQMPIITNKLRSIYKLGIDDPSFHKNAAHVSYFGINTNPLVPEIEAGGYYMVETALNVYDQAVKQGKTVTRLNYKHPKATPKYWKDRQGQQHLLPEDLMYPGFPWDADSTDVTAAFNAGNHYIFTYAHGSADSWSDDSSNWDKPVFASRQMGMVNNADKLPYVFSVSCLTGNFNRPDGMAKTLLNSKDGACGVVASPLELKCYYAAPFAVGLFKTIWPDDREGNSSLSPDATINLDPKMFALDIKNHEYVDEEWYAMGNIVDLAMRYERLMHGISTVPNHLRELIHIYGDPGIFFNTETPTDILGVRFWLRDKVVVDLSGKCSHAFYLKLPERAVIGVYNETKNEVTRYYTDEVCHPVNSTDKYHVVITKHNKIPLEFHVDNGVITASGPYIGKVMSSLLLHSAVQKSADTVAVSYVFDETEAADYNGTILLKDLNNNILATEQVTTQSGTVTLSSPFLRNGIYVVVAQAPSFAPEFQKILIR